MHNNETFTMTAVGCGLVVATWLGFMIVFQELWNWIGHSVFGMPELSFWQAVGVYVLLSLIGGLFGSRNSA